MNKLGKPTIKDYLYVSIQLVLFLVYALPVELWVLHFAEWLRYSGLVLAILGLVLGIMALIQINTKISPFPTPVSKSQLITNGAFSIARHPIYTSVIAMTLGYAVFDASLFKFIICLALWWLFYFKSIYEEQLLVEKFPQYSDYKQQTRRFI
ncbi:methyltransferase family protein [Winogradskyella thalassocola]|uniref:Protein-S-isoprenylcysteine O-methyltransferase Ste14 n=1 Tax=Winogradskyella thalassocola TaxID=262004 RepID=A0A1G8LBB5_9FLAO|nr:isoprenylcysteine carboxylmethyltransferase family protein [Winogradskyella thalassocola]SDI52945.1 Protein-S-isoprenylcysteine O-methyltransferase Ste14 [Winogradskyella thalassocola]